MPNDPCGGSGAPSGQSAGVACAAYENLAADAAAYLARSGHTAESLSGGPEEIDQQAACLVEWAIGRNALLGDDYIAGLKKHTAGATAEHEVFFRESDNRAVKRTYTGTFGVTPEPKGVQKAATPAFYLSRLDLMNDVFGSDLRLEGVGMGRSMLLFAADDEKPSMVISQPWFRAADSSNPHPSVKEIAEFMESLGFSQDKKGYYAWFRPSDAISVTDARPDNYIKTAEGVVPIDLVICQSKPPVVCRLRERRLDDPAKGS